MFAVTRLIGAAAVASGLLAAPIAASAEDIVIGHSQPNLGWPYIAAVTNALEAAAADMDGVEVVTLSADGDIAKQSSDINSLVNRGVDVLLVTSLEMSSIKDTKTAVRVLGSLGVDSGRIRLVINDSTSASAITPDDVAEATGLPVATSIPHDRQLGRSVQRGVPVYLEHRGGTFPRAVADLAGSLAGVTTGSRRRRLPFLR